MAWSALLVTHASAAALAIPLGAWQLFRSTKGSHQHRMVGRVWVVLMLYVAITSFWIRELRDGRFSLIHVLSVVTVVTVSWGLLSAWRGDVWSHRVNMTGSWLGLVGAFIGATAVPTRDVPQFVVDEPVGAASAVACVALITVLLVRLAGRMAVPGQDRIAS
jgi:uncharacterized membrane protein